MLIAILLLLAGSGVFIAGMNMLSDGLDKSAGSGLKRMLGKISNNRFAGVGIGAGVTAIIQSSAATTVMAIGFVNAGVMTLFQATAIIMGANIGTTITGVIVSLKSLGISTYAGTFAFIGVMMTFIKSDRIKQIGSILCGFGMIFVGLDLMGAAFDNYPVINEFFSNLFATIDFPLLLILCGLVFTALIQSSSAATGLFITMVGSGALTLDCALFLVLGSNIGTCVTALLAGMSAGTNAKRTAIVHLLFNVIGTILFAIIIWILRDEAVALLQGLVGKPEMQLAWFHVIFNVTTTLILLPFIKQLVAIASRIITEKKGVEESRQLKFVDDLLLKTPPVALMQVKKEMEYMADVTMENLGRAFGAMRENAEAAMPEVVENEAIIDFTNKALTKYLIKLSPLVDQGDEKAIGAYFHVLNDLERIGDHAENFAEIGVQMQAKGLAFSETAKADIQCMQETVMRMFAIAAEAFDHDDKAVLSELGALEEKVDEMKKSLSASHYARLAEGNCKVELSPYFTSTIAGLERVADHLVNVGYSILNPTGSQSEAKKAGEVL